MRKFFTLLTLIIALFCLTSCNMDKIGTFIFSYESEGYITDDADRETLTQYIQDTYMAAEKAVSFTCKSSEAMERALNLMIKDIQEADNDYIYSFINYEEDYVVLTGILSGDNLRTMVGYQVWKYEDKFLEEE